MRATWTIAKREIFSFFVSPLAYVVITSWLAVQGTIFTLLAYFSATQMSTGASHDNPVSWFFGGTTLFYLPLLVIVPLLTMRLLAEETRQGTLETLFTAPISSASLVLGKYLAAMVFWVTLWAPTFVYAFITSRFGDIDLGALAAIAVGLFGVGLYYMSLGTLMSAIAKNQIVAATLTFVLLMVLFTLGLGQFVAGDDAQHVAEYLSVWQHMQSFSSGLIDTRFLVYDVSVAALGLYLSVAVLETRRNAP